MREDFIAILEIWADNDIKFMVIEMAGDHIPQPINEDRDGIVKSVQMGYPDTQVLDLVGITDTKGVVIWRD